MHISSFPGRALALAFSIATSLTASISPSSANAAQPITYSSSDWYKGWAVNAIKQQNHLDHNSQMRFSGYPTTHNSFNSGAYSNASFRYSDPNQSLSIYDQLRSGIRAIEMDAHWTTHATGTWPWEWKFFDDLLLCHAQSNNVGCHTNDRGFNQGVDELTQFLNENPNEVVILYIEDYMRGHYSEALNILQSRLGSRIYNSSLHYGQGCGSLPRDLSKAQVRAAGKNLLIVGAESSSCGTVWNNVAFQGHFHQTIDFAKMTAYPGCAIGTQSAADWQSGLTRAYNDSTTLSGKESMSLAQVQNLVRCGVGAVAPEPLNVNDDRHTARVWSWAVNEPNNWSGGDADGENCAEHAASGRFNDASCKTSHRFACQHATTRAWRITSGSGIWQNGQAQCQAEFGADAYAFATPSNGYENARLVDAKAAQGLGNETLWLNYADLEQEGAWVSYRPVYTQWPQGEENKFGCAALEANGLYQSRACDLAKPVACQHRVNGNWQISQRTASFANAQAACSAEFGVHYGFAVPASREQYQALTGRGVNSVWLNLRHLGYSSRLPGIMLPKEAAVTTISP